MQNLIDQIYKLDSQQLEQVISAVKLRRNQLHSQAGASFLVGDKVEFDGRQGRLEQGTVQKIKIKYVLVETNHGTRWNVPAGHLRKVA